MQNKSGFKSTWFSISHKFVIGLKRVTVAILEWLVMTEDWPPLFPLDPPAALEPVCWLEMPPAPLTMALATPWARTCFPPITLETEGFPFATRICPLLIATCLTADWSVELTGIPTIWRWERHQMTHDCVHCWQLNDWWASALCFIGKPWQTDLSTCCTRGPSCLFLGRHGDHVTSLHCDKLVRCRSCRLLLAGYCGNHLLLLLSRNFPWLLLDNHLHRTWMHRQRRIVIGSYTALKSQPFRKTVANTVCLEIQIRFTYSFKWQIEDYCCLTLIFWQVASSIIHHRVAVKF